MAMQEFVGRVIGIPKKLETTNTHREVVHVVVSFLPPVKIEGGKLPEFNGGMNRIQLSFWDEEFMDQIMAIADKLPNKMIRGYCDNITQRDQYYNATGLAFVVDSKAKVKAPEFQMISSSAPKAPVAPV